MGNILARPRLKYFSYYTVLSEVYCTSLFNPINAIRGLPYQTYSCLLLTSVLWLNDDDDEDEDVTVQEHRRH